MDEIITSWSNITLRQGKNIFLINNSGLTDNEYIKQVAEEIYKKDFTNLQIEDFAPYRESTVSLLSSLPKETDLKYTFNIIGQDFGLEYDLTRTCLGAFIDLEMLFENNGGNVWTNIEQVLACIIRPLTTKAETKNGLLAGILPTTKRKQKIQEIERSLLQNKFQIDDYNSETTKARADLFLDHLTIADVYSIILFFCGIGTVYINNLNIYLQENQTTPNLLGQQATVGNGTQRLSAGLT